jgi:hypothetical protein
MQRVLRIRDSARFGKALAEEALAVLGRAQVHEQDRGKGRILGADLA